MSDIIVSGISRRELHAAEDVGTFAGTQSFEKAAEHGKRRADRFDVREQKAGLQTCAWVASVDRTIQL